MSHSTGGIISHADPDSRLCYRSSPCRSSKPSTSSCSPPLGKQYSVQVLAYSRVGDGYLSSPPLQERTYEDVPGPPSNVSFPDVSFTTAR